MSNKEIVYGSQKLGPRVIEVIPRDDYTLLLIFDNSEIKIYDFKSSLHYPVYKRLNDIYYFKKAEAKHGTVEWPNEEDVCPDTLYEKSTVIKEAEK